jgi:hypothetical protein
MAEVRLLVLGSQFSKEFNARIVEKRPVDLTRCMGTVKREEMMAS